MKAPPFKYLRPQALEEVFEIFSRYGEEAKLLAGGQSLLPALNMRLASPAVLVDINAIGTLRGVCVEGGQLRIGALTRHCELERSSEIAQAVPLLRQAIQHVAHAAIRNRGTFGGSIAYADPAAELPAVTLTLGARFVLRSSKGERKVQADRFFRGMYETALQPDEVLIAAEFPIIRRDERFIFSELARRQGDFAIVGVCAQARIRAGCADSVRIGLLGAGAAPVLATAAMQALEGRRLDGDSIAEAQRLLERDIEPMGDLYATASTKRYLARVQLGRTLEQLRA